jgi:hypothetical protein
LVIKKTLNKLSPVEFMHCFVIPILDRAIVVNYNFGCAGKEKTKIFYDNIFVVKVGTSLFSFMLATCGEHASGGGVGRTANNFA